MLTVLNGKLWLSMFWDKRQTFGGWGWVAERQERVYAGERAWSPKAGGSYMAGLRFPAP